MAPADRRDAEQSQSWNEWSLGKLNRNLLIDICAKGMRDKGSVGCRQTQGAGSGSLVLSQAAAGTLSAAESQQLPTLWTPPLFAERDLLWPGLSQDQRFLAIYHGI